LDQQLQLQVWLVLTSAQEVEVQLRGGRLLLGDGVLAWAGERLTTEQTLRSAGLQLGASLSRQRQRL
jgi:hypothetical protein